MKKVFPYGVAACLLALAMISGSCSKDDKQVTADRNADTMIVKYSNTAPFVFYNFKYGKLIPNNDSASYNWDFGLRRTTFILNSHAYGKGFAAATILNSDYDNTLTGPLTGLAYDTTTTQKAIPDGSWFDTDPVTQAITPKAGKTFIFKTADKFYVKMEITAVDIVPHTGPTPVELIYHFRYTYQADGTNKFY